jgi:thioredoxin 1
MPFSNASFFSSRFFVTFHRAWASILVETFSEEKSKGVAMLYFRVGKWQTAMAATVVVLAAISIVRATATGGFSWDFLSAGNAHSSTKGEENMSTAYAKSSVLHADETTFAQLVLNSKEPVLVDFYADWCGPCKRLAPILEELSAEVPRAKIVKINVEQSPSLAAEYGVNSIPSLKLFENGTVREELVGLASMNQLKAMIER